jgi:hypothetical protein
MFRLLFIPMRSSTHTQIHVPLEILHLLSKTLYNLHPSHHFYEVLDRWLMSESLQQQLRTIALKLSRLSSALHFPLSLYIPELDNPLTIAPNQLRTHGIVVNDTPLFALPPNQRDTDSHCILSPEHSLRIPLKLDGVISYFQTRKPTIDEIRDRDCCVHVEMCSFQNWNPYADHFLR